VHGELALHALPQGNLHVPNVHIVCTTSRMDDTTYSIGGVTRRDLSVGALMALFAGVVITVTGCGSDDSPTGPSNQDRAGSVSANHGHAATVTSVQITSGDAVQLNIQGSADHPHSVDLSGAEVTQIGNGQRVSKPSSSDTSATFGTHLHTVTFN
jgi:hypothetical protein